MKNNGFLPGMIGGFLAFLIMFIVVVVISGIQKYFPKKYQAPHPTDTISRSYTKPVDTAQKKYYWLINWYAANNEGHGAYGMETLVTNYPFINQNNMRKFIYDTVMNDCMRAIVNINDISFVFCNFPDKKSFDEFNRDWVRYNDACPKKKAVTWNVGDTWDLTSFSQKIDTTLFSLTGSVQFTDTSQYTFLTIDTNNLKIDTSRQFHY